MKVSIIDWIIKKLKRCIAIVEEGNTASQAIGSGKYVMWKGNLYTADTAISSGTTLAASGGSKNLTAVPDGGYNDLNGKISTLNSNVATYRNTDGKLANLSTSLNDVKTSGRYYATWQCTNTPTPNNPGYVDVYAASDTYIKQSFYDVYSDKVYTRRCENGTWSVWEQLALNSKKVEQYDFNDAGLEELIRGIPANNKVHAGIFITASNTPYVYIGHRNTNGTSGTVLCFNYADSKLYKCVLMNNVFSYYTIG